MTLKRALYATTLAAGVGLAGLAGVGLGTASADPGWPCNAPGAPPCRDDQHHDDRDDRGDRDHERVDWQRRNVDDARRDHRSFNWGGQEVHPMPAGNGAGWGFWFLGTWIPL